MEIEYYKSEKGREYVRDFIYSQSPLVIRKILATFQRISCVPQAALILSETLKPIKKSLWEIRVLTSAGGFRFLYVVFEGKMLLLEAFRKTTNKTPKKHIETALQRYQDFLIRKKR
jgi:phage-related protein